MLAGLSASKANYKVTIESVQNPGEFLRGGVRDQRRSGVGSGINGGQGSMRGLSCSSQLHFNSERQKQINPENHIV